MAVPKMKRRDDRRTHGDMTPPEGGWGWLIVAGCFLATICIRAVSRCISMFFVEFQMHFGKDYASTAWIHSLIDSTTMLCAPLGGFLGKRLSCRATVILGGLLSTAGLIISSFATSLEYLYVFLGILTGLGFALSYTPAIAMVGMYFSERKALAFGIALSGTGIGTFILPPVVQMLISRYTWRGALLVLGGFVSNLCVCGALMKPLKPRGKRTNQEQGSATAPESTPTEQVAADCSPAEGKQLDPKQLLLSKGVLRNIGLEREPLGEGDMALLSDMKITDCILFSNKFTETVLGELKRSEAKLSSGNKMGDMRLVESVILSHISAKVEMETEEPRNTPTPVLCRPDDAVAPPPLVKAKTRGRGWCWCLRSSEEFGFLLMPEFLVLSVSILFMAYGCSAPIVYLVPYAHSVGVGNQNAAFLMSIFGGSGIVGNLTYGWITDRKCLRRFRMLSYMVAIVMEGLCLMFIPLLRSFALLVPFSVIYGYFDGAYVALIPVVTSDVVGSAHLASALGVVYFLHAVPYLISPPIGGWLVDRTGDYATTFYLSGICFIFSSGVLCATMLVRQCQRSKCKSTA